MHTKCDLFSTLLINIIFEKRKNIETHLNTECFCLDIVKSSANSIVLIDTFEQT